MKIKGDLINSNLYKLTKGMTSIIVENFYSENQETMEIPLEPHMTPVQNLQKYYSNYKKTYTAEKYLKEQIENSQRELLYLETVMDSAMRASGDTEIDEIRRELAETSYLKSSKVKNKKTKATPPIEYISSDGFKIYAGKNNIQNDLLTMKKAKKEDMWFHTQKIPGSHVVVITGGEELPDQTYTEAAMIAAYNSKAQNSAQVSVDYTSIKNIKKPANAKPGMVIYDTNYTAYITPDEKIVESLLAKNQKKVNSVADKI